VRQGLRNKWIAYSVAFFSSAIVIPSASAIEILPSKCTETFTHFDPDFGDIFHYGEQSTYHNMDTLALILRSGKADEADLRLKKLGYDFEMVELELEKQVAVGFQVRIPSETTDPFLRTLKKIKAIWDKEKIGEFPAILLVPDSLLGRAGGFFDADSNQIWVRMSGFGDYLTEHEFPITLQHELRHAGIWRFRQKNATLGFGYLQGSIRSEVGGLSSNPIYDTLLYFDEPYTHLRDLRRRIVKANRGYGHHIGTMKFEDQWTMVKSKFEITQDVHSKVAAEAAEFRKAIDAGEGTLFAPFGRNHVSLSITRADGSVHTFEMPCRGCALRIFGRKENAANVLRKALDEVELNVKPVAEALKSLAPFIKRGDEIRASLLNRTITNAEYAKTRKRMDKLIEEMTLKAAKIVQDAK